MRNISRFEGAQSTDVNVLNPLPMYFCMDNLFPNPVSSWTLDDIEKLLKMRDVESAEFDFKGCRALSDLSKHLCAMANTQGGFIVLGIDEKKDHLVRFKKNGFRVGEEDNVNSDIRNQQMQIEPIPKIETKIINDTRQHFFVVIHIRDQTPNKPYFLKEKGTCYVRIGASTTPAPRSTVLRLFSNTNQHVQDLKNLKTNISVVKEALDHLLAKFKTIMLDDTYCAPQIDLALFRASVIKCEPFLRENNMLENVADTSSTLSITNVLHTLDTFNTYLVKLNDSSDSIHNKRFRMYVMQGMALHRDLQKISVFFASLNRKIDEYLERMHENHC